MGIFDRIYDFFKDILKDWVLSNFDMMFSDVNDKVGLVSATAAQTPSTWNGGIFNMITGLSDTVIVPIAGIVISFVLTYELISMVMDKNNMHDFDSSLFFRYILKAFFAVWLVSNTQTIVMAVFELGSSVTSSAGAYITGSTRIDVEAQLVELFNEKLEDMELGELLALGMESMIVSFGMEIMSILILVVLYGRMVEVYIYTSIAPIPFATLMNREWGSIGTNYIRGILALAFQSFFIIVCVAIYAVLVSGITVSDNIHGAIWSVAMYTVLLCFSLFKTASISKSVFAAH